ncbi:MAG: hypothetical protein ACM3SY_11260 [Candidatus Omnitrophota bacterium]
MPNFYKLIIGVLCVWRITHLFQAEDGPWDVFVRFRRLVGDGFWGKLLDCFYCLSMWTSAPFAYILGQGWQEQLLLWPALSGGAILLERFTDRSDVHPASYFEDENMEDEHGMLR